MASVKKLSRDKRKKNAPYYIQFFDHNGKRRTTKGCPDKGVSETKAAQIESLVERIKAGLATASELDAVLGKRQSPGVVGYLDDFEKSLRRKGDTEKHVKLTMGRVRTTVAGCEFRVLADLNADDVEEFVADFCEEKDYGHRTYNHYVQAVDSFGNWLADPKRRILPRNPFAGIVRRNAETDVRHPRRALTSEEFGKLVNAARTSDTSIQCFTGEERSRIYVLSYMTGLRRGELASLTPKSFTLDVPQPVVTVEAGASKHRRKDVLPLHAEFIPLLRTWLAEAPADEPLFPKLAKRRTWLMVKKDLASVGIPYRTDEGIADFHAAGRHTHVTELLKNGASLPEARQLARHSDVRMTMKYTHVGLDDQAKALKSLPCLHIVCTPGVPEGHNEASDGTERHDSRADPKDPNPGKNGGYDTDGHKKAPPDTDGAKWRRRELNPRPAIFP